jgi:hypothetical protein
MAPVHTREADMPTRRSWSIALALAALLLPGCAHQPTPLPIESPGFLWGLLHGFLVLFSLVGSLFTDVRIYAFPNSGFWYDVGYFIGASAFLGGGAHSARRSARR